MSAFLAMGGYAVYVWPAYAIALGGLAALSVSSVARMRRLERAADEFRQARRKARETA